MMAMTASGDVTGAATKTILSLLATSTRRPKLLQLTIGCSGTPADNAAKIAIRKITADGTGTGGTTFPTDSADGAPSVTTKVNYTVEPTYTSGNLAEIDLNQRATVIWNAPLGAEPACAIGAGNGIGIQMIAGPTLPYNISAVWSE